MIIGITGQIGSGKSTVSKIFSDKGYAVVNADHIAHEILQKDEIKETISRYFSKDIFDSNGDVDRKKLGDIVFKDKRKLQTLNKITHDAIAEEIYNRVERIINLGIDNIVLDVPIPVRCGFSDISDFIIAVIADEEIRRDRIMERNRLGYYETMDRIKSGTDIFEYIRIANSIINNNEDEATLIQEVEDVITRIEAAFDSGEIKAKTLEDITARKNKVLCLDEDEDQDLDGDEDEDN